MLSDGSVVTASRHEERELFSLVLDGPMAGDVFDKKRRYDPAGLFSNELYERYRAAD